MKFGYYRVAHQTIKYYIYGDVLAEKIVTEGRAHNVTMSYTNIWRLYNIKYILVYTGNVMSLENDIYPFLKKKLHDILRVRKFNIQFEQLIKE